MTGRHRKPTPSAGLKLSRVGALAVLATAPLMAVGTASASPAAGTNHSPEKRSHDHGSDRSTSDRDDSDSRDDAGSDDNSRARHRRGSGHSQSAGRGRTHYLDLADEDDGDTSTRPSSRWSSRSSSRSSSRAGSIEATDAQFDRLAQCESSRNWDADTGNGYKGGLQFNDSTWRAYGGSTYAPSADQASREEQIAVAKKLQRQRGWSAWPSCGNRLGNT